MIVFDLEIINPPVMNKVHKSHHSIANGWNDHKGMGISVIGWYDYRTDTWGHHIGDDNHPDSNLIDFQKLVQGADLMVGFNNINFDNKVCRAAGINIFDEKSYDILREIWYAVGLSDIFDPKTHGGYGLDACAQLNLGLSKTGNGALAPYWWQDGKYQQVIDYCMNDVKVTKMLLDKIFQQGGIKVPRINEFKRLSMPKI